MTQPSIAVDLGTANTRIYVSGVGSLIEKPSSIRLVSDEVDNVSDEYFNYINRKLVSSPLRGGVIVDLKKAVSLLKPLIVKTRKFFMSPVSLACAPTDTSEAERALLCNALVQSGSSRVSVIPEVWAAALGAGMDVTLPTAQLLIDIGEGVTDMALFRDGRLISASATRIACANIHRAVRSAIMAKYRVNLYDYEVERLTNEVSSIANQTEYPHRYISVSGIDILKRCEVTLEVDNRVIVDAILPVIDKITEMIDANLKRIPEKIYCEILESGICLTGGGACVEGMDRLIAARTHMAVRVPADPIHAVINGAMQTLDYWNGKKCWWENIVWPKLSS